MITAMHGTSTRSAPYFHAMANETHKGFPAIKAASAVTWRTWLERNHSASDSIWLIIFKKNSGISSVTYQEAVDEALCFGWVDSKPNKRDDASYYQFFSPRNPKSNWSRNNKERVARLIQAGKMAAAGHAMIAAARENGTWDALNDVENLILPPDLRQEFNRQSTAFENWQQFPDSVKRAILEWIFNAKQPSTRLKRIRETVEQAAQNIRANQYRQ
ncbi:MAG: YdeI/OmpD-associated family protein [Saprospiraceae bacterium]|nr:YdeI/OmpD-associated family protein [Saprospiraceae bacterium]